jgi:hypothetical protein
VGDIFILTGTAETQPDGTMRVIGVLSPGIVPPQVEGLRVADSSDDFVALEWARTKLATSWVVERAPSGGAYAQIGVANNPDYEDLTVAPDTAYDYRVLAQNSAGPGPYSDPVTITTTVTEVPATPTGLFEIEVTSGSAAIGWDDASDAAYWTVLVNSVEGPTQYTESEAILTGLSPPEAVVDIQVKAHNSIGSSAASSILQVTLAANGVPVWIADEEDLSANLGIQYSLDLAGVCFDADNHPLTFSKPSGTFPPGIALNGSILSGTPTELGDYVFTLRADDGYDQTDLAVTFPVTDADVTSPTNPADVLAVASGSTVTVTCEASSDASGIKEYRWFRNGTFRAVTGAPSFQDTGVPNGTYIYGVQAVDASANANASAIVEAPSVVVSVTTAPDVPVFTTLAPTTNSIQVSWVAGPNGPTPDQYILKYATTSAGPYIEIFNGLALTYNHTGLSSGTQYFYKVFAFKNGVAASAPDTDSAATTTSGTSIEWIPGHWWQTPRHGSKYKYSYRRDNLFSQMYTPGNSAFKGHSAEIRWAEIETTKGNVDLGLAQIQAELNACAAMNPPRRLMLQFCDQKRGLTMATYTQVLPPYMGPPSTSNPGGLDAAYHFLMNAPGGDVDCVTWDMTNGPALTAFLAMWDKLAAGMKALDNYNLFHGWRLHNETTASAVDLNVTSKAEFQAFMETYGAKVREVFPDKMVWNVCPVGGLADGGAHHEFNLDHDILLGQGDVCPDGSSRDPTKRFHNKGQSTEKELMGTAANYDGPDIREPPYNSVIIAAVEGSELGQEIYFTYTAQRITEYCNEVTRAPYIFWQTWEGKSGGDVDTDIAAIRTYVHANPTLENTDPPGHYP